MSVKFMTCLAGAAALMLSTFASLAAEGDAIKAPAQKKIGTPANTKTEIVPSLIVMNSDGASLDSTTLTLKGISLNAIMFADRPVRSAGHALTAHLLEEWEPGKGSFASDPPNATVSVFSKDADTVAMRWSCSGTRRCRATT